jgi:two-component system, NarL family, response regulator NreC
MARVTVVLAENHELVREGFRLLIQQHPGFEVVGEAADGLDVIPMVQRLRPDLLLLDLVMPGLHGIDIIPEVRHRVPRTRIIVVTMYRNDAYVAHAWRDGVSAYVLKDVGAVELIHAVREALAGRRYLSPPLSEEEIARYWERMADNAPDPYDTLTRREREVLQLLAEGLKSPEIADRLGISARTVETHRANLMRKLGFRSPAALGRFVEQRQHGSADDDETVRTTSRDGADDD